MQNIRLTDLETEKVSYGVVVDGMLLMRHLVTPPAVAGGMSQATGEASVHHSL